MKITQYALKNPITVLIIVVMIIVSSVFAILNIPIEVLPQISYPTITIQTVYPTATPDQVQENISVPLENALSSVSGILSIESRSLENVSVLVLSYDYGIDLEVAKQQLRQKVDSVKNTFPSGTQSPVIESIDVGEASIMSLAISSSTLNKLELTKQMEDKVLSKLERIDGVASIDVIGLEKEEVRIHIDPNNLNYQLLSSKGLTMIEIANLIGSLGIHVPGGTAENDGLNITIKGEKYLDTLEKVKELPLITFIHPLQGEITLRLKDIAIVEIVSKKMTALGRLDGEDVISFDIFKKSGFNTASIIDDINQELKQINQSSNEYTLSIISDQGGFIDDSINNVLESLLIGGVLAILILILFLRNLKGALIVTIAIPVSLFMAVTGIYFIGIPLNIVSLGGLAISTGMVVDAAIVVLERMDSIKKEGHSSHDAAVEGVKSVGQAVVASTITTIAVFLPVVFTSGFSKEIFSQISYVVTFSLISSLLVAFTIVPLLFKMLYKLPAKKRKFRDAFVSSSERIFLLVENFYSKIVKWALKFRWIVVTLAVISVAFCVSLVSQVGFEFLPQVDQGIIYVDVELPMGTNIELTKEKVIEIEKKLANITEVSNMFSKIGSYDQYTVSSHKATITLNLIDESKRQKNVVDLAKDVRSLLKEVVAEKLVVNEVNSFANSLTGSQFGDYLADVSIMVKAPSLEQLEEAVKIVMEEVEKEEYTRNTRTSLGSGAKEARFIFDYEKIVKNNWQGLVNPAEVMMKLSKQVQGIDIGQVATEEGTLDLIIGYDQKQVQTLDSLLNLMIATTNNENIYLKDIGDFVIKEGYSSLLRIDKLEAAGVYAEVSGDSAGNVNSRIKEALQKRLGNEIEISFSGQQKLMEESFNGLFFALIVSILLVYAVMAIQFQSLKNPFIIMLSLPLGFTGSIIMVIFGGFTFNVASFIGAIMLVGIVVNNAIVLIDRITQLINEGVSQKDAIILSAKERMRPILMTALTTILALLPLMFAKGGTSALMASLSAVVAGGLISSTVLTLVIIPVIFDLFHPQNRKFVYAEVAQLEISLPSKNSITLYNTGMKYYQGVGVKKNMYKALDYFEKAAEEKNMDAIFQLIHYYQSLDSHLAQLETFHWYEKAYLYGSKEAIYMLGMFYLNGTGVIKNLDKAFQLFEEGEHCLNELCTYQLGVCYQYGYGTVKNEDKAYQCFKKAYELGNKAACKDLYRCYNDGIGVEKNLNIANKYYLETNKKEFNS